MSPPLWAAFFKIEDGVSVLNRVQVARDCRGSWKLFVGLVLRAGWRPSGFGYVRSSSIDSDCEAFDRALLAKILGVSVAFENVDQVVLLSECRRDTDVAVKEAWQSFDSFKVVFSVFFGIEGLGGLD